MVVKAFGAAIVMDEGCGYFFCNNQKIMIIFVGIKRKFYYL